MVRDRNRYRHRDRFLMHRMPMAIPIPIIHGLWLFSEQLDLLAPLLALTTDYWLLATYGRLSQVAL
jgi:hypothetical protein